MAIRHMIRHMIRYNIERYDVIQRHTGSEFAELRNFPSLQLFSNIVAIGRANFNLQI